MNAPKLLSDVFRPLPPKQQRYLLIASVIAVPIIIFLYFVRWKTYEIYGDDLTMYFTHQRLSTLSDKLNMPVFYGKYRPIQGVVTHILIEIFKKHMGAYFLFNIAVQSLNTLFFALSVNLFLRSPFLSLLFSLLLGLSRFAFFSVTQVLSGGPLEGLAMTFFLLALFFMIRALMQERTVSQKQRDILWAFVAANFSFYTHERYIVFIPFMLLLILFYPGFRAFTIKQKGLFFLTGIVSIALNIAIKKYFFGMPFMVGTGGTNISLSFSSMLTYFTEGFLSIFQINYGPEYLIGIKFTALPAFDKVLLLLLLGSYIAILVLYIKRIKKAFALKQKDELNVFIIFLSLGVLFFLFLAPAIITIRLEQRWLQASFSIFVLMIALAWSRIPVKNRFIKNVAITLFVLVFSLVNFSYLNNGAQYIYLTSASNIASSFKRAINNGIIPASADTLYIWEKQRDENTETEYKWSLEGGEFFQFYQNKFIKLSFIDPSYLSDSTKALDTLHQRVLYYDNSVSDVTSDYLRSPNLDFKVQKVNNLMTFQDLGKFNLTGFYASEGGFRWTDGNAAINFGGANFQLKDSVGVTLRVVQLPVTDKITPQLVIRDNDYREHRPLSMKKEGDKFTFTFYFEKAVNLHEIGIQSATFDASPDSRVLSLPIVSLEFKN